MEHWPQIMGEIHADRPKATGRLPPDAVDLDRRLPGNRRAARTNRTPGSGRQTAMPIVLRCENAPDRRVTPGGAALRPTRRIMKFAKRTQTMGSWSPDSAALVGIPDPRQVIGSNQPGRDQG
jgi:hypothetical protein